MEQDRIDVILNLFAEEWSFTKREALPEIGPLTFTFIKFAL